MYRELFLCVDRDLGNSYDTKERTERMKRSDCSLEKAGCSMVTAVTQDSVNAVLKEYLDGFDGEFVYQTYYLDIGEKGEACYEYVDYSEVKKTLGMDLYEIPDEAEHRTQEQEEVIKRAYEELGIALGFRFRIGLPEAEDVSSLRDIVQFIESDSSSIANVLYTMYLKEFEILEIVSIPRKGYVFSKLKQDPDRPWYFVSRVKLDMKGKEVEGLPQNIKDKLIPKDASGKLNVDQILSIQQLYMDLNTARLTDEFKLEGLDDRIYSFFRQEFMEVYVNKCKKKGDIILGYMAKQFQPGEKNEFAKYEDFNFCITPYYKEDGTSDPGKQGLYTLNYLFAASGEKMGDLKQYANAMRWNWVDETEKGSVHGRMAVDRKSLMDQIAQHFADALKELQIIPKASADVNLVKAQYSIWTEPDRTDAVFTYSGSQYNYEYNKSVHVHKSYLNTVDVKVDYKVNSKMTYGTDRIDFSTSVLCTGSLNVDGGIVKGTLYDVTLDYGVRLSVNSEGKLVMEPDQNVVEKKQNASIKSDVWIDMNTFGTAKNAFKQTQKDIENGLDSYKNIAVLEAKGAFSDMNCWVFPGGRVFSFKGPEFTSEGNTVVGITYVKPDDGTDR